MMLASFSVVAIFAALLWGVSAQFRHRFAGASRVPMQWGIDGKPTWYARPRLALSFTPMLGTGALIFVASLSAFATPSSGQLGSLAVLVVIGVTFVAVHVIHLRIAARGGR